MSHFHLRLPMPRGTLLRSQLPSTVFARPVCGFNCVPAFRFDFFFVFGNGIVEKNEIYWWHSVGKKSRPHIQRKCVSSPCKLLLQIARAAHRHHYQLSSFSLIHWKESESRNCAKQMSLFALFSNQTAALRINLHVDCLWFSCQMSCEKKESPINYIIYGRFETATAHGHRVHEFVVKHAKLNICMEMAH